MNSRYRAKFGWMNHEYLNVLQIIIEARKTNAAAYANREVMLMYWEVGHYINSVVLDGSRAAYGK